MSGCSIQECPRTSRTRGLCAAHYQRWRRYGDASIRLRHPNGGRDALVRAGALAEGEGECLPLPGKSRPTFRLNGKSLNASRAVWIIAHGDPGDLWVLHTCNNDRCIRLGHLYLGTVLENNRDAIKVVHGPRQVLTHDAAEEIRTRYAAGGISQRSLAAEYGVTRSNVSRIINFRTWANVSH